MAIFDVGEATGNYALDEGMYDAILASIEDWVPDPNKPRNMEYGDKDQLVITYRLTQDSVPLEWEDGSEATKRQWVNKVGKLTPQSTLYGLFSTLLNDGQPLDKERQYDTAELVNLPCQIFWGAYTGKDGSRKFKIQSVSAPKKKATAAGLRPKPVQDQIDVDAEIAKL